MPSNSTMGRAVVSGKHDVRLDGRFSKTFDTAESSRSGGESPNSLNSQNLWLSRVGGKIQTQKKSYKQAKRRDDSPWKRRRKLQDTTAEEDIHNQSVEDILSMSFYHRSILSSLPVKKKQTQSQPSQSQYLQKLKQHSQSLHTKQKQPVRQTPKSLQTKQPRQMSSPWDDDQPSDEESSIGVHENDKDESWLSFEQNAFRYKHSAPAVQPKKTSERSSNRSTSVHFVNDPEMGERSSRIGEKEDTIVRIAPLSGEENQEDTRDYQRRVLDHCAMSVSTLGSAANTYLPYMLNNHGNHRKTANRVGSPIKHHQVREASSPFSMGSTLSSASSLRRSSSQRRELSTKSRTSSGSKRYVVSFDENGQQTVVHVDENFEPVENKSRNPASTGGGGGEDVEMASTQVTCPDKEETSPITCSSLCGGRKPIIVCTYIFVLLLAIGIISGVAGFYFG